jgi:outer membrane biosynthesis protein TonB
LQSTGFPAYDKRLVEGVRRWRYAPYRDDLGPTAVCTAVTFIYAQR